MAKETDSTKLITVKDTLAACYSGAHPTRQQLRDLDNALAEDDKGLMRVGNLASTTANQIVDSMGSDIVRVIEDRYLPVLKDDLGWQGAPRVVKMAIDAVVIAWLRWQHWEQYYTKLNAGGGMSLEKAIFWERRLTAAHSRYLQALTTLARVQKLARRDPLLQVNIAQGGGQQLVITGDYKQGDGMPGKDGNSMDAVEGEYNELQPGKDK